MCWSRARLTVEETERAIFVDYEGTPHSPPTLLGVMVEGEIELWIVEEAFMDCADRWRARTQRAIHAELAQTLVERAVSEDRRMVSWSTHDAKELAEVMDPESVESLCQVYRNAIKTARSWRFWHGPEIEGQHTLQAYMDLLAWQVPEEAGQGVVGNTLASLRDRLTGGVDWTGLSAEEKSSWRHVLRHNRHDLRGMEHVLKRMALDLDKTAE